MASVSVAERLKAKSFICMCNNNFRFKFFSVFCLQVFSTSSLNMQGRTALDATELAYARQVLTALLNWLHSSIKTVSVQGITYKCTKFLTIE